MLESRKETNEHESRIKKERERIQISIQSLALILNVELLLLQQWEAEADYPSASALLQMSWVFGCSTDFLLGLTNDRQPIKNRSKDV